MLLGRPTSRAKCLKRQFYERREPGADKPSTREARSFVTPRAAPANPVAAPPAPMLVQPAGLVGVLPRVCVFVAPPRVGLPRQWPCTQLVYQAHCVCGGTQAQGYR